jgi:asparagine synthase (glutamine-hydrolysing)
MWHPFMGLRIVEFGLALPAEQRWRDGRAKDLLRRTMAPYLPEAVAARTTSPDATHLLFEALRHEGGHALFQGMTAGRLGWIREDTLTARFERAAALYRAGDPRYAHMAITLWHVAAIELWARAITGRRV